MASIEVITSREKEITVTKANGETSVGTVRIWNETVSNLTLMALGSSAPEILLSLIEGCGHPFQHLRVFFVTASWSIFAYIWLYLILAVITPGVVQVWEAFLTLLFFPACVVFAWAADKRLLFYKYVYKRYRADPRSGIIIGTEAERPPKDLEADGGFPALPEPEPSAASPSDAVQKQKRLECGGLLPAELPGQHLGPLAAPLAPGTQGCPVSHPRKTLQVKIVDDEEYEKKENFFIELGTPRWLKRGISALLLAQGRSLRPRPRTRPMTMDVPMTVYVAVSPRRVLMPRPHAPVTSPPHGPNVPLTCPRGHAPSPPCVPTLCPHVPSMATQHPHTLSPCCVPITLGHIPMTMPRPHVVSHAVSPVIGTHSWREQFLEAITVSAGDEDEDDEGREERLPSCFDYVMHFLTVFWKVLFACVPPTALLGGWAAFGVSILLLALLTALIGDLAAHFGCTLGLKDSVNAVVFVALGTSIPGEGHWGHHGDTGDTVGTLWGHWGHHGDIMGTLNPVTPKRPPQNPPNPPQVALLDLNFLPTSGSSMSKQQLILARDIPGNQGTLEHPEEGHAPQIPPKPPQIHPNLPKSHPNLPRSHPPGAGAAPGPQHPGELLCAGLGDSLGFSGSSDSFLGCFDHSWGALPIFWGVFYPILGCFAHFRPQYLMEGSYNKVFLAKGNIPAESYTFFIDILLDTIRDEIAGCIEAAYERILFPEAARILFFSSPRKMTDYAKKGRSPPKPLNIFPKHPLTPPKAEDPPIPSTELATQVIEYARQLEMIV
ncbi:PREDICTED: uncharacterized protein LOC103612503 [Corvus brachyrhynchos]|nr:PREDICTED: uncharacterized protein LOC103612503 [Corvus brachyrhynchos]